MAQAISVHPGYVRGLIGEGDSGDDASIAVRLLALTCYETLCHRALIVGDESDASVQKSVCRALDELGSIAHAQTLRVALVGASQPLREVYERAGRKAAERGITARVFADEPEAVRWLHEG
jgi:hypothetical protein